MKYRTRNVSPVVLVAMMAGSTIALADNEITLQKWNGTAWVTQQQYDDGDDVSITGAQNNDHYQLFCANPATQSIGDVTLSGTSGSRCSLIIGQIADPGDLTATEELDSAGCHDLKSFNLTTIKARIHGWATGDLTGSTAKPSSQAWRVLRLDVDGQIQTSITHDGEDTPIDANLGRINAGSIASGSTITAINGDINFITVTSGDMAGTIIAEDGDIGLVTVQSTNNDFTGTIRTLAGLIEHVRVTGTGGNFLGTIDAIPVLGVTGKGLDKLTVDLGNIGAPGSPATINSGGIWIGTGGNNSSISLISAKAIYADINAEANGDDGSIRQLFTTDGGFVGMLQSDRMTSTESNPGYDFVGAGTPGDFDGDLIIDRQVHDPVEVNILTADSHVQIGTDFGTTWTFADSGLKGNIVISANGDGAGEWFDSNATGEFTEGKFKVGTSITLAGDEPRYGALPTPITSADLGGGAVGVVPFPFHEVDSSPDYKEELLVAPTEIIIEYYGPIVEKDDDPELPNITPYIVQRAERSSIPSNCVASACSGNSACDETGVWTNLTNDWDYVMHPGGNTRRIKLTDTSSTSGFSGGQSVSSFSVPVGFVYRVRPRSSGASNTLLCDVDGDETNLDRHDLPEPLVLNPGAGAGQAWQCDEGNYIFFVSAFQTLTTLDLDTDGVIGIGDVIEFGTSPTDINRDGVVDVMDAQLLLDAQGEVVDG